MYNVQWTMYNEQLLFVIGLLTDGKKNQVEFIYIPAYIPALPIVHCTLSIANWLASGKADGLLVVLGFDVTIFTPAPYQRHRL